MHSTMSVGKEEGEDGKNETTTLVDQKQPWVTNVLKEEDKHPFACLDWHKNGLHTCIDSISSTPATRILMVFLNYYCQQYSTIEYAVILSIFEEINTQSPTITTVSCCFALVLDVIVTVVGVLAA